MDYDKIDESFATAEKLISGGGWTQGRLSRPVFLSNEKVEYQYCLVGAQRKAFLSATSHRPSQHEYIESLRLLRKALCRGSLRKKWMVFWMGIPYFSLSERFERQIFALNDHYCTHQQIMDAVCYARFKIGAKVTPAQVATQIDHDLAAGPN